MKLRDDPKLVAEAATLVTYACGPFGSMYTAEDIAIRILDAIDRRTPAAPPDPMTRCGCYLAGETEKTCCDCVCHKPAATPGTAPIPPSERAQTHGGTPRGDE